MALNDTTHVGLANRFKVTIIPEGFSFGSWQKAEGLDVAWDMPDYRAGDAGNHRWYFPANTKYTAVKLVRAACDDSKAVKKWLSDNSFKFQDTRSNVKIELFDSTGTHSVVDWELQYAQIRKWAINSMDAGASSVSVETIEFDHMGFLEDETQIGA